MKYLVVILIIMASCNSQEKSKQIVSDLTIDSIVKIKKAEALNEVKNEYSADIYDTLHIAFEGYPDEKKMQGLFESVLTNYKMPITNANIKGFANLLISLRKQSKLGVTEMDILKHMYQNKDVRLDLPRQAEMSSNILEKTK